MRLAIGALMAMCVLALSGCAILPASGPTVSQVENSSTDDAGKGFVVVDIDDVVAGAAAKVGPAGFVGNFRNSGRAADLRIAVGDVLQVGIIEAGTGLFGQADSSPTLGGQPVGAQSTSLQPITVARDGYINVPFAGRLHVAGRTPEEVRIEIERLLSDKAVKPQVEVSVASNFANSATVSGEVNRAGVYPLSLSGNRLLDLIAAAGGARFPAYEVNVRVTRGGRTATASLQNVVDNPNDNLFIQPRDSIYLSHEPRTFTAFGATTKVGRYPFASERLSLAEAVAVAGGMSDVTADPAGVFLFRFEPAAFVESIKPELSGALPERVPVVYRLNLRVGNGYFVAQRFPMRDKDVILLSTADGSQLLKFFLLIRGATGIVNDLRSVYPTLNSSGN